MPEVNETSSTIGPTATTTKENAPQVEKSVKPEEEISKPAEPQYDLTKFQLTSILQNNSKSKSITLLGKFPDISQSDQAIVLFEKKAFRESDVQTANGAAAEEKDEATFFNSDLLVQTEFINNIYGSFECVPGAKLNAVKTTVVYPATEKHIEKYSICQKYLIQETPELYEKVTLPFITSSQFSLEWVYNILEHKQETDRIIYEDPDPETGFILLPDLKWDGRSVETLYLLAISHKHDIKSLRDLDASHLPLLTNMRKKAAETIEQRYGLSPLQLRMYFHYQPSFYHFHLHINPLRNDAPGIWCEKSHILDTVINNLELMSDYYKRATLPFVLFDGSKLLERYEQEIPIRKCSKRPAEEDKNNDANKSEIPQKRKKCVNDNGSDLLAKPSTETSIE